MSAAPPALFPDQGESLQEPLAGTGLQLPRTRDHSQGEVRRAQENDCPATQTKVRREGGSEVVLIFVEKY